MNIKTNTPVLLGGWLTDAGSYIGRTARGVLTLAKSARGDTADMVIEKDVGPAQTTQIIYGLLAAVGIYLVVKK